MQYNYSLMRMKLKSMSINYFIFTWFTLLQYDKIIQKQMSELVLQIHHSLFTHFVACQARKPITAWYKSVLTNCQLFPPSHCHPLPNWLYTLTYTLFWFMNQFEEIWSPIFFTPKNAWSNDNASSSFFFVN